MNQNGPTLCVRVHAEVNVRHSVRHTSASFYLVVIDQLLLHHLHGVDALRLLQLHQQHLGVAASADHPQQIEVGQAEAGGRLPRVCAAARLGGQLTQSEGRERTIMRTVNNIM